MQKRLRKNPKTSHEAYRSLSPKRLAYTYEMILKALVVLVEADYESIAEWLKWKPERVWKRLSEMERAGQIYRTGDRKKLKSGRWGMTWRLTSNPRPVQQKPTQGDLF